MVWPLTLLFVLIVAGGLYGFFRFYAPFGGQASRAHKASSKQFDGRKFVNLIPTPMNISFWDTLKILKRQLVSDPERRPAQPLVPEQPTLGPLQKNTAEVMWFGHSAFLVRIGGKTLLLDPMLSDAPSPFPALGPKRFSKSLPITPEDLPHINAIVISHDHYDHLDYESIKKLADKTDHFFVPIGVAAHLLRWGITSDRITELDWWQEHTYEGITFACTPSRHFSGRTLSDRFATLWCSWVIISSDTKLYFSGDTGYGPHFKDIGAAYGPFDLTLLECGQYDKLWPNIHMMPEDTVRAHQDLGGKRLLPIHWGAFVLSLHPWTDPVKRVLAAGKKAGVTVTTPKIGELLPIKDTAYRTTAWWEKP